MLDWVWVQAYNELVVGFRNISPTSDLKQNHAGIHNHEYFRFTKYSVESCYMLRVAARASFLAWVFRAFVAPAASSVNALNIRIIWSRLHTGACYVQNVLHHRMEILRMTEYSSVFFKFIKVCSNENSKILCPSRFCRWMASFWCAEKCIESC